MIGNNPSLEDVKEGADRISHSARRWIVPLARFGYVAKGVVYIIIGLLAALAAFTNRGRTTDSRGALEEIIEQPYGRVLLGAVAIGLASYALWRVVQAINDTENKGSDAKGVAMRVGYAFIGLIYASLAYSAVMLIMGTGGSGSGDQSSREGTALLLSQPFGRWLVGGLGAGIIAFAIYQFYKAYTAKFREKLNRDEMSEGTEMWAVRTGQAGLAARGVVFGIIGFFLMQAAFYSKASQARGLSGALRALEQQPSGQWMLGVVGLGLVAYGIFMLMLGRYRRIIL
jgi:hypothetical protein